MGNLFDGESRGDAIPEVTDKTVETIRSVEGEESKTETENLTESALGLDIHADSSDSEKTAAPEETVSVGAGTSDVPQESDVSQVSEQLQQKEEPSDVQPEVEEAAPREEIDNFARIMRRSTLLCLIKALLLGIALAAPTIGGLLLLDRFEISSLGVPVIAVIGAGVLLAVTAASFFLLKQSAKSIAMRLDREHNLSEKVQTMLAFKDVQSPMTYLQRRDANAAVASVKNTLLGIRRLWIYILCFVIGVSACVVSFFFNPVPDDDGNEPPPEIPFAVTELQLTALEDLIAYVGDSEMQEPYKAAVLLAVTTLYDEIGVATTMTQRDAAIAKAMDEIFKQTDLSSAAVEIMNALWGTNATAARRLAKLLNYYDLPKSNEWDRFEELAEDFRESFVHADAALDDADEQQLINDTRNVMLTLSMGIGSSIKTAGLAESDPLHTVLTRLASANEQNADGTRIYGMTVLVEYIAMNGYAKAQRELDATVTALKPDIYKAITYHSANTGTGEYAMSTIASIFDVEAPDFKRPELRDLSSGSTGDGESGGGGGAIGGGPSYGSDDEVYDPIENKFVEYGTILEKYRRIMFGKVDGGKYTDEERKALEEYFAILYGGFDDKNENK